MWKCKRLTSSSELFEWDWTATGSRYLLWSQASCFGAVNWLWCVPETAVASLKTALRSTKASFCSLTLVHWLFLCYWFGDDYGLTWTANCSSWNDCLKWITQCDYCSASDLCDSKSLAFSFIAWIPWSLVSPCALKGYSSSCYAVNFMFMTRLHH